MFGQAKFAALNSRINTRLAEVGVLVVAHRGCGHGSIADNTALAVKAAALSGADVVELDVSASRDGEFFCFHDGYEPELLGLQSNLQTLTAAEIDQASYLWVDRPGRRARVERLLPLLESCRGTGVLFNLDRSWWRWPQLLRALRSLRMADQLILKCPAWEEDALGRLREFGVKFPFVPICATPEDVYRTIGDPDLNTVGAELITTTPEHPWFNPEVIKEFHKLGVFCFVNAETLTIGFAAGAIGIGITLLLILPLNAIIHHLSGLSGVAALPAGAAVILVAISMLLTFLAGLIPSRIAAKKDPVIALRSE